MSGTVYLVEDDAAVRDALTQLLEAEGLRVRAFASAEEYLEAYRASLRGCLLVDLRLPGLSGLEMHDVLSERGSELPVIFLTGHGDVPSSVRALRSGAFDFLQKPARAETLVPRIRDALRAEAVQRRRATTRKRLRAKLASLTPREREILPLVAAGRTNKAIARALGISHRTVEVHRSRLMHKLGVGSVVDLAPLAKAARST